jgi:hypothetical protein
VIAAWYVQLRRTFAALAQSYPIAVADDGAALVNGGQRSILPRRFEVNDGDVLAFAWLDAAAGC